jgi:hypothetical protein
MRLEGIAANAITTATASPTSWWSRTSASPCRSPIVWPSRVVPEHNFPLTKTPDAIDVHEAVRRLDRTWYALDALEPLWSAGLFAGPGP